MFVLAHLHPSSNFPTKILYCFACCMTKNRSISCVLYIELCVCVCMYVCMYVCVFMYVCIYIIYIQPSFWLHNDNLKTWNSNLSFCCTFSSFQISVSHEYCDNDKTKVLFRTKTWYSVCLQCDTSSIKSPSCSTLCLVTFVWQQNTANHLNW